MILYDVPKTTTIEIQKEFMQKGGKIRMYQSLILGQRSLLKLVRYELVIGLTSWVPGAFGLLLRSKLYPGLLGYVGKNVTFGQGVVLRHPHKIFIGNNVVIDDQCVLDAKGSDNRGIFIGDGVFLGRNTILNCKNGDIILEDNVNIGFNSMIFSASSVRICRDNLIAAYCYLVGGTHRFDDPMLPILQQPRESKGIVVEHGGWLGAHVTVFDGVHVGRHCVIAAGTIVNKEVSDFMIAGGSPVRMIKQREVECTEPVVPSISVGIINYNGEKVLGATLDSILAQERINISEILVADDGSTDGSVAFLKANYPQVKIVALSENRGPNPGRNRLLEASQSPIMLLMDNDIVLEKNAASLLTEVLQRHPEAGIAGPQIRNAEDKTEIQYNGADIHYAGGAVQNPHSLDNPVQVGVIPGGAMLIDVAKAKEIGLFDEDYFYGWADGDFSYRMTLAGHPCLSVSKAHVFHKKPKKKISRIYYQIRNRWWFILKTYNLWTLLLLFPAILFNQLAMFLFLIFKGEGWNFIRGSFAVWATLPQILKKRKAVLAIKQVRDKEVLSGKPVDLVGSANASVLFKIANGGLNGLFAVYWFFVRWLIR